MIDREDLLLAGQQDRAQLAASLIPERSRVHVAASAPTGLDELLLSRRGVTLCGPAEAEVIVGGPESIVPGCAAVVTSEHSGHGSMTGAAATHGGRVPEVAEAARAAGRIHATVRLFEGFEAAEGGPNARDPEAWIRWFAIAAGPAELAPPPLLPSDVDPGGVLLLAEEPWNHWPLELRSATLDLHDQLRAQHRPLAISWLPRRLGGALGNHLDLRRAEIAIHGGDGVFDLGAAPGAPISPNEHRLIAGHRPAAVVVLARSRATDDLEEGAGAHPETRILALEGWHDVIESIVRVDDMATIVADVVADATSTKAAEHTIAKIEVRPRRTGLTSVVIPVHGRWDLTGPCLDSLLPDRDRLEVIVVDNASPDETARALAERDDVTCLSMTRNLGFAGGTNVGLRAAKGEYVCLLNNDTEVVDGWLDAMLATLATPGTQAVGPRSNLISGLQMVPDAPRAVDESTRAWGRTWSHGHRGRSWLTNRLVGFCLMMRGSDLERLGGLDEGVGVGNFEDDQLCARIREDGGHLRVADGAVVLHHGSATFLSQEIDYLDAMRSGRRHVGTGVIHGSDLLTAYIVMKDLESIPSAAMSASVLADEIFVLVPSTQRLAAKIALWSPSLQLVTVADIEDPPKASAPWTIWLPPGQALTTEDWGGVRAAIERLPRRPHQVGDPGGPLLYPSGQPRPETPPVDHFG